MRPIKSSNNAGNLLLDRLPKKELDRLMAEAEAVPMPVGHEIYRQGDPVTHAYFPRSGVCSVVLVMTDGRTVEAAIIGNEGMVGLAAFLELDFATNSVISQVAGDGWRIPVAAFTKIIQQSITFDRIVRHYVGYGTRYAQQTIACNALHSVEERACRWLLMTHDRVREDEFELTHEFLAQMLGVHRQTVTLVAGTLQRAGLIGYQRGLVRILEREGLEEASCECYQATKDLYERIMGSVA